MLTMKYNMKNINQEFSLPEYYERSTVEMDQESNGSSVDEGESPKSVDKRKMNAKGHIQVLRIRAEDSHLGEDIGEGVLSLKDKFGFTHYMLFSRPMLPASPLSGKTAN